MSVFRYALPLGVRVRDLNYGGHVGNDVVLGYFQEGRAGYLQHVGGYSEIDIGGCGIILPEAHILFRKEMFLGDELMLKVRISELGRSSFRMEYRLEKGGEAATEGWTSLVAFDYRRRRPVRLPEAFIKAVRAFEGMEPGDE